ncbi:MAG: class I SAM-dependent methyltransferase [Cyanobacteria bacterium K_Offshore_surface_m2_239]|nr:class I SAM-dependent methyltransferase [Cyanobacteria bacterium K_Offshore_surface_m2_239]
MLKRVLRRWIHKTNPLQDRWDYFQENDAASLVASHLIKAIPDDKLTDITYLETELIPALGLNNENLHEQPQELSPFMGTGLHVFQYPNQLSRYLAWLTEHAKETRHYVEIGSRWGGTFIVVCEWLRRIGAPLSSAIAVDPIGETPMIKRYGEHLVGDGIDYQFIKDFSTGPVVKAVFEDRCPDFVFIDGDHSMRGALADHMLARQCARIIVHHDISSDACPETTALWQALKELERGVFAAEEFIDQYPSVKGSFLGIGALKRSPMAEPG